MIISQAVADRANINVTNTVAGIGTKTTVAVHIKYNLLVALQDLEDQRRRAINDTNSFINDRPLPLPEDDDDISQYKFAKFAATYFQGSAAPTYIRRALKCPLLALKNEGDQLVRIS